MDREAPSSSAPALGEIDPVAADAAVALRPMRILFVFAWLVVGGEETEVRLLAQALDRARYTIDVVACFRKEGMPEQTHAQLEAIGVKVDRTPYHLSMDETVAYLPATTSSYPVRTSPTSIPRWNGFTCVRR